MRAHSIRLPAYRQRRPPRASVVSGHTPKQGRRHAPYATAAGGFQGLQALSPHRWPPLGAFIKLPALRVVHDFVWVKPTLGLGNYWRNSHELCLLAGRGGLTAQHHGLRSWDQARRGQHSAKPAWTRDRVEQLSPGPYLELFGRTTVPGWTVWGNACEPSDGRLFHERF